MRSSVVAEGAAGLVAAPMFLLAFGLFAGPPTPAEAATTIVSYLEDHRTQVFASMVLLGAGSCLYVWFLAGLRRFVSPDDTSSLGTASVLSGLLAVAAVVTAMCVLAGAVLRPVELPFALITFDIYNALVTVGGFGFGFSVVTAAIAASGSGAIRAGHVNAGLVVGAVQLTTIPGLWVDRGFFAPLGTMAVIAFVALTGWYSTVAWAMVRRQGAAE